MLAKSDSFFSGADYEPPEQTFDYAAFTSNAHFTIYSRTHRNVTSSQLFQATDGGQKKDKSFSWSLEDTGAHTSLTTLEAQLTVLNFV